MHDQHKINWIKNALRRASYRWPPRSETMKEARLKRNTYLCALCKKTFGRKHIQLDHISPVINPKKGWQGWDEFIKRLFVDKSGWQVVCKPCHKEKSNKENEVRREQKPKEKQPNKGRRVRKVRKKAGQQKSKKSKAREKSKT